MFFMTPATWVITRGGFGSRLTRTGFDAWRRPAGSRIAESLFRIAIEK
jgi:hypothetical protein